MSTFHDNNPCNRDSNISRRSFLRWLGAGAVLGAASACGISSDDSETQPKAKNRQSVMTRRFNPNTADSVSLLGFGMKNLPTIEAPGEQVLIDQDAVNELVDYAIAHGVNYFDTTPDYTQGFSEEATGIALSRYPRDSYFIATKISNFSADDQSLEESIEMFETSLRNLRTSYVDYLLLHAIGGAGMADLNDSFINNGVLDWFIEQKKQGRIRNLGFSFQGDIEVFDSMLRWMDEGRVHWDIVQIQLNYIDWFSPKNSASRHSDAEYLYSQLALREIPIVVMDPMLAGSLAKVPASIADRMKQKRPQESVASWALRFAGTHEGVLTVLSEMEYMEHLEDCVATFSPLEPITSQEMAFLKDAAARYLASDIIPCTGCGCCMPCPYGIDIPAVFAHYNKCVNHDNMPWDRKDPRYAEARRAFLVGYDRTVPKMRQASRCIACGACEPLCPQEIHISDELRNIDDYTTALRKK